MALTRCPECRGKASTAAAACPHCGHPLGGNELARPPARATGQRRHPWYYSTGVVAVTLVALPPVGIVLMWAGGRFPLVLRVPLSLFLGAVFVAFVTRESSTTAPVAAKTTAPRPAAASTAGAAPAPVPQRAAQASTRQLPPDPGPTLAHKADEVPGVEAELRAIPSYASVWAEGHEADRDLLLTGLSEAVAHGAFRGALMDQLGRREDLKRAVVLLFGIHARTGSFPEDFQTRLEKHVEQSRKAPRLGLWKPPSKHEPPYDMTALGVWLHRDRPAYIRERIAAAAAGPLPWAGAREDGTTPRPYLVDEEAALEWLARLTSLTADEQRRLERLKLPGFGDRFELGAFAYFVDRLEVTRRVGGRFVREDASDGARFVLVHYTLENLGTQTETVMVDDLVLVDARGRQFRASSRANTALAMSQKKTGLVFDELQPGLSRKMVTAFEVPEDVTSQPMTLVVAEKGILGTGKVEVAVHAP